MSPAACVVVAAAAVVPECDGEPAMRREKKESERVCEREREGVAVSAVLKAKATQGVYVIV